MAFLKNLLIIATAVVALGMSPTAAAKGKLGFVTEVDVSGVFRPVLKHVKVASIVPGSPAEAAGMKPGDYIVEVNGRAIAGAPAKEMAAQIRGIRPGEQLRLKLKRGSGMVDVTLTASP
jgi:C-terminal processing protease CtpA/Prc